MSVLSIGLRDATNSDKFITLLVEDGGFTTTDAVLEKARRIRQQAPAYKSVSV
ncbi:hypothetical protein [Rhodomicrobium lacus]|uniref:hypothetical protein n=1 Tax=Rhodomicrobium lacus TaxID=2498452 RepID=UPI0026E1CCCB|nr:hypothetical protein [Rhodomicrobium lacus]WKW52103.1 hypothetical protein QMO75_06405 [Rhodomicrobium lacus]